MELWPGMYKDLGFILQTNDRTDKCQLLCFSFCLYIKIKMKKINAHTTWSSASWAFAAVIEALPQGRKHPDYADPGLSLSLM